jgi:hypothetical protein
MSKSPTQRAIAASTVRAGKTEEQGESRQAPDRHRRGDRADRRNPREPERTIIPAHRVEAVIHQPFGAYPTAVFGRYDYDAAHLKLYVEHSKRAERVGEYLDTYIRGTKDHWDYLERCGGLRHLESLKAERIFGY